MRKLTCDTCGRECQKLNALRDEYQTDDVVEVCDKCMGELDKTLNNIKTAQRIQIKKMMRDAVRVFRLRRFGL